MKAKVRTIKQKVVIPASPKDVYDAYVDPKKQSKFTAPKPPEKRWSAANLQLGTDTFLGNILSLRMENVWFKSGHQRIFQKAMALQGWSCVSMRCLRERNLLWCTRVSRRDSRRRRRGLGRVVLGSA